MAGGSKSGAGAKCEDERSCGKQACHSGSPLRLQFRAAQSARSGGSVACAGGFAINRRRIRALYTESSGAFLRAVPVTLAEAGVTLLVSRILYRGGGSEWPVGKQQPRVRRFAVFLGGQPPNPRSLVAR
jgi:hypothetical protein